MKTKFYLALTGFAQVFFVSVNTFFLANSFYLGVFVAAFLISLIWSFNIKKIAFGVLKDRLIYSIGAAFGSVAGLYFSSFILQYAKP